MTVGNIYIALVDAGEVFDDTIHNREDEEVFKLTVSQSEGSFARADVEIRNPSEGLLAPTRPERVYISYQDGPNVVLLFSGRIVGFPSDISDDIITLEYIGQPEDWEVQQAAFLQTLKTAPEYNELFIDVDRRDEAEEILAGRSELLHWTRDTNVIGTSDILEGSTFIDLGSNILFDSLKTEIGDPPVSQVNVNVEAQWEQIGIGTVDVGSAITAEFTNTAVATPEINTLTPLAFEDGWRGVRIPAGYSVRESKLSPTADAFGLDQSDLRSPTAVVSGVDFPTKSGDTPVSRNVTVPRVWYEGTLVLQAQYRQKRREVASATIISDTQSFSLKGNKVEELNLRIQNPTEVAQGEVLSPKLPSFFYDPVGADLSVIGRAAIEHGLKRGMARLKKASRIIEATFDVDINLVIGADLDTSMRADDTRFPGGSIRGKMIGYVFSIDGDTGEQIAQISLAAAIGEGDDSVGSGSLTEEEIGLIQYDNEFGATPMNSSLFYDLVAPPVIDQSIDVAQMESDDQYLILTTNVSNGGQFQSDNFDDNPPMSRPDLLLQNNATGVTVDLRTLNPEAELFAQIDISTFPFGLPRQTDLEAP